MSARLTDGNRLFFGHNFLVIAEQSNDKLWDGQEYPGQRLPPPTYKNPVDNAFFSFLLDARYSLDIHILASTFRTDHFLSPFNFYKKMELAVYKYSKHISTFLSMAFAFLDGNGIMQLY